MITFHKKLTHSWHQLDYLQQLSALALVVTALTLPRIHNQIQRQSPTSLTSFNQRAATDSNQFQPNASDFTYLNNQHQPISDNQQPTTNSQVLGAQDFPSDSDQFQPISTNPTLTTLTQSCQTAGGTIAQFSHACADLCLTQDEDGLPRPGIACAAATTTSCECGPTACWNGTTCQPYTSSDSNQQTNSQSQPITTDVSATDSNQREATDSVLGATDSATTATDSAQSEPISTDASATDSNQFQPTSCLPSDFNGDGYVDMADRQYIIDYFFTNRSSFDLNQDNIIDIRDYSILVKHWHQNSECQ